MNTYIALGSDATKTSQTAANNSNSRIIAVNPQSLSAQESVAAPLNTSPDAKFPISPDVRDTIVEKVTGESLCRVVVTLDDEYSMNIAPVIVKTLNQYTDSRVEAIVTLPTRTVTDAHLNTAVATFDSLKKNTDGVVVFSATSIQQTLNADVTTVVGNRIALLNAIEKEVGSESVVGEMHSTVTQKTVKALENNSSFLSSLLGSDQDVDMEEIQYHVVGAVRDTITGGNALTHRPTTATSATVVIEGPESHTTNEAVIRAKNHLQNTFGDDLTIKTVQTDSDTLSVTMIKDGLSDKGDVKEVRKLAKRSSSSDFSTIIESMTDITAYDENIDDSPLFKCSTDE